MTTPSDREILARYPDRAELTELPGGGHRILVRPDPGTSRKVAAFLLVGFLSSIAGGWVVGWLRLTHRLDVPLRFGNPWMFYFFAMGFLALGALALILRVLNGPPKPTVFEVSPGRLKIDRYLAGDHIVREYSSDEIRQFFVDSALTFNTRLDDFSLLAAFCPRDLQIAVARLLGAGLWGESVVFAENVSLRCASGGRAHLVVFSVQRV